MTRLLVGLSSWRSRRMGRHAGEDGGKTWDDSTVAMVLPERREIVWDRRACKPDGRKAVVIAWCEDMANNRRLLSQHALSSVFGRGCP